jgi:hypothetical protein
MGRSPRTDAVRRHVRSWVRTLATDRFTVAAAALGLLAGVVVFVLATDLFAYHSVNDDEGVYLLQAAMLLEGQVFLRPGPLGEAVRPWFFVVEGSGERLRMYAKYTPVAAAVFALGMAVGDAHLALAATAAGTAALVCRLTADFTDRTTGLVAGVVLLASPLFLITSSVFLSYAPTTLFNLAFAVAYVRAVRRRAVGWGLLAGVAVGLAFFTRAYTAVLFALPFVAHRVVALVRDWRRREDAAGGWSRFRETLTLSLSVALPGLAFVGLALAYNAVVTGSPTTFPYEAFGPQDGLGFGERELLGYDRTYTPALAATTTLELLEELVTRWTTAGPVGVALALVGVGWFLVRDRWRDRTTGATAGDAAGAAAGDVRDPLSDRTLGLLVAALLATVVLGNAYFWGTLNGLLNGLIRLLGPYYHFDLLVPLSAFGAVALVEGWRGLRSVARDRLARRRATALLAVVLLVAAPGLGVLAVDTVQDPVADNRLRTDNLAETYEPFRETDLDHAVVLTADPYGDWQQHPFQYLRNDPGFDGDVVYATEDGPARNLRVLTATDRTPYRFTFQGTWRGATGGVTPALQRLRVHTGESVAATTTVGVPDGMRAASVRVVTDEGTARYETVSVADRDRLTVRWRFGDERVRVTSLLAATDRGAAGAALPDGASEAALVVTFVDGAGGSVTYRQTATVETGTTGDAGAGDGLPADAVRVVWPPETVVCELTTDCGSDDRWVGPEGDYPAGVSVATNATASG